MRVRRVQVFRTGDHLLRGRNASTFFERDVEKRFDTNRLERRADLSRLEAKLSRWFIVTIVLLATVMTLLNLFVG